MIPPIHSSLTTSDAAAVPWGNHWLVGVTCLCGASGGPSKSIEKLESQRNCCHGRTTLLHSASPCSLKDDTQPLVVLCNRIFFLLLLTRLLILLLVIPRPTPQILESSSGVSAFLADAEDNSELCMLVVSVAVESQFLSSWCCRRRRLLRFCRTKFNGVAWD